MFKNRRGGKRKIILTKKLLLHNLLGDHFTMGVLRSVHEKTDNGQLNGQVVLTNQTVYWGGRLGMLDKTSNKLIFLQKRWYCKI